MSNLRNLLGCQPSSSVLKSYVQKLAALIDVPDAETPQISSYSDCVYFNYYPLGLSLLFKPRNDYKLRAGLQRQDLEEESLVLESLDIYHILVSNPKSKSKSASFSTHPVPQLTLQLSPLEGKSRPLAFEISRESSGKDFVKALGEPDRKGGGAGPSSGSIAIWCEWSRDGIMVEFGGEEAIGPHAWETGKDAVWRVLTIFSPASG
jgi:hypothetical protein